MALIAAPGLERVPEKQGRRADLDFSHIQQNQ